MTILQDAPASVAPALPAAPTRSGWGRWAQLAVTGLAAALYLVNLSVDGLGNPYYAAAVKSGTVTWKAFLFGSFDPGSFTTVDKPPAAFWVQELSARIFGYSSGAILVPEALAGAASVAIVYHLARRMTGSEWAGVLSGLALAVTPMATVMWRFNDPDGFMTFLLVAAAWAVWVAVERASVRHLVVGGVLLGLAFDAKMLMAFVALPGLALAWLIAAPTSWRRRLVGGLWGGLALVVSAGWWVALVELWPKADRPYIASTTDNSLISLIFGYNGLSRLFGAGHGGAAPAPAGHAFGGHGAGPAGFAGRAGFGGGAGWDRMFGATLGTQISWLLPLAGLGLVVGLVSSGRAQRWERQRAGFILWGGWAVAAFLVFSLAKGTFHPYYTVALAPAVAVLAGAGAVMLWRLGANRRWLSWLLPLAVVASAYWAYRLLDRDASYHPWLRAAVLIVGALAAVLMLGRAFRFTGSAGRIGPVGGGLAAVALLAGPGAWSLSTVTHAANGTNPTAGPASAVSSGFGGRTGAAGRSRFGGGGGGGGGFGGSSSAPTAADQRLVTWLEANRDGAEFIIATDGSTSADDLVIASGEPVMDMGGFSGSDPNPTLAEFEKLVAEGRVRYVLVGGGGGFGGGGFGGGFGGRGGTVSSVLSWVTAHGRVVPASDYGGGISGTIYQVGAGA